MGGRIEVDPTLPPVDIPGRIVNEMCSHALETLPEECCGLLSGTPGDPFRTPHRCRNEMTRRHRNDPVAFPRDGKSAFYMNELDILEAQTRVEGEGNRVTAIYHSHVGGGAYFSELDQAYAAQEWFPFPNADHIVIALLEGRVTDLGIFQKDPRSGAFLGRAIRPAVS